MSGLFGEIGANSLSNMYGMGSLGSAAQQAQVNWSGAQNALAPRPTRIYVIGALKNPQIIPLTNRLETEGYEVFSDWFSPGPETDTFWQSYEQARGRDFATAIRGPHARNVFEFDKHWLDWADVVCLVLPAGKSGHLELGYCVGRGKRAFVLFDEEPARWDVMYAFCEVVMSTHELIDALRG